MKQTIVALIHPKLNYAQELASNRGRFSFELNIGNYSIVLLQISYIINTCQDPRDYFYRKAIITS